MSVNAKGRPSKVVVEDGASPVTLRLFPIKKRALVRLRMIGLTGGENGQHSRVAREGTRANILVPFEVDSGVKAVRATQTKPL